MSLSFHAALAVRSFSHADELNGWLKAFRTAICSQASYLSALVLYEYNTAPSPVSKALVGVDKPR
jgi:hypothetical protein